MKNDTSEIKNSNQQKYVKIEKFKLCFKNAKAHCKTIFSSKIFIAVAFTLIGIAGTVLAKSKDSSQQYVEVFPSDPMFNSLHGDPFFSDYGVFAEMKEMQNRMNDIFANHQKQISQAFEESKKNNNTTKTSASKKEDDKNYYYELNFAGFKKEDIVVSIKNNLLTFSAEKKKESDDKNKQSYASNFYYSFSIPKRDENVEPEISKQDDKVVVKFVKK